MQPLKKYDKRAYLTNMELFYKGRVTKVVLVFLGRHVVGSHDVLLEHELLRVLLTLAQHALIHAPIGPVIFANFD